MRPCNRRLSRLYLFGVILGLTLETLSAAGSGKIQLGEPVPTFSVMDVTGQTYTYTRGRNKALLIAFFSKEQSFSSRAQKDLEDIIRPLGSQAQDLDMIVSTDDPNAFRDLLVGEQRFAGRLVKTLDQDKKLWGAFGIIAIPTVVICGKDDKVLWSEAGYGYDFAPQVRTRLNQALGITQTASPESAGVVGTVQNNTLEAQIKRLLQAADLMSRKGHIEAAILEVQKARQLDPNAVDVYIKLGELFCKNGQGGEALRVLQDIKSHTQAEETSLNLVLGWAHRLEGHLDEAKRILQSVIAMNARSARAFFELGRVYEQNNEKDQAIEAYRHALKLVFDEQ